MWRKGRERGGSDGDLRSFEIFSGLYNFHNFFICKMEIKAQFTSWNCDEARMRCALKAICMVCACSKKSINVK
jgi:hypothetical protein